MVRSTSRARLLYLLFSLLRSHAKHAPAAKKSFSKHDGRVDNIPPGKKQQIDLKPPELKSVEVAVHKVHERLRECQPHRGARDIDPYIHDGRQDPGFADDFGFRVEPPTQARYAEAQILRRVQRMKTAFLPTTANTSARGVWLASPQQASGGAIEPPVVPAVSDRGRTLQCGEGNGQTMG